MASRTEGRSVVISAWSGTDNAGDELLLRSLLMMLPSDLDPIVISRRPETTSLRHGVTAVGEMDLRGTLRAIRGARALILGPGGLLQDETSVASLPRHLWRVAAARRLGTPVVGVGLGAGPLGTPLGRALVARALRDVPLVVRDEASAELLAALGLPRPEVTADLALVLAPSAAPVEDAVVVCLRPYGGRGGVVPAEVRDRRDPRRAERAAGLAAGLDDLASQLALPVRFVAFEGERDHAFHEDVARLMSSAVELRAPDVDEVLDEVARGRVVVACRYHAGIAAVIARRPLVLLAYTPKVRSLATQVESPGVVVVDDAPHGWRAISSAGRSVADQPPVDPSGLRALAQTTAPRLRTLLG